MFELFSRLDAGTLLMQYTPFDRADAVIDLPGIAVIGNQSAGKSSLVEALSAVCISDVISSFLLVRSLIGVSQITVPRNANTCTRYDTIHQ